MPRHGPIISRLCAWTLLPRANGSTSCDRNANDHAGSQSPIYRASPSPAPLPAISFSITRRRLVLTGRSPPLWSIPFAAASSITSAGSHSTANHPHRGEPNFVEPPESPGGNGPGLQTTTGINGTNFQDADRIVLSAVQRLRHRELAAKAHAFSFGGSVAGTKSADYYNGVLGFQVFSWGGGCRHVGVGRVGDPAANAFTFGPNGDLRDAGARRSWKASPCMRY